MTNETDAQCTPPTTDVTTRPSIARMYDYLLGGGHHFAADRAAADLAVAHMPDLPAVLRANREFLGRVVTHLVAQGVRQFIDLGSGIPTVGSVHEAAHRIDPTVRVVYVDVDPVAVVIADELLAHAPGVAMARADLRDPEQVLTHPQVRDLIDFDQPVALLLVAVLHLIPEAAEAAGILHRLYTRAAGGSWLAVSHMSPSERQTPTGMRAAADTYAASGNPLHPRTHAQIEALLGRWQLQPPGLVACPLWRPNPDTTPLDATVTFPGYAGLARKPAPTGRDDAHRRHQRPASTPIV